MLLTKKYDLIRIINLNHTFFKMKKTFIQSYYDFFDRKIQDSTLVVGLIWFMIFLAWFLANINADYTKSSVLEFSSKKEDNIVYIEWKKYKILLQELK